MPSVRKVEKLKEIQDILKEKTNFVVTTYSGLNVEQMSEVRRDIREHQGVMKVVKNNLFRIALKESPEHQAEAEKFDSALEGPTAVTFVNGDFPAVSKLLVKVAKDMAPVEIKAGCMDGKFLETSEVQAIATLPSREEMLGIIGRGLNAPAQKIATGMNEIMASLARGLKALGEKNGG